MKRTSISVAQEMIDRFGWFVFWSPKSLSAKSRPDKSIGGSDKVRITKGVIPKGSYMVIGPATQEQFDIQRALVNLPPRVPGWGYLYRAVAE